MNEPLTKDKMYYVMPNSLVSDYKKGVCRYVVFKLDDVLSAVRLLREKGYCKNCYTSLSKKGFKCKATESGFHDFIIPLEDFDEVFGGVEKK